MLMKPAEPNYQEFLSKVFGIVQHPEAAAPTPSPPPPVADGVPFRTTLQSFQFYESEYSNFSSYVRDSGNAVNAALKTTNSPKVGGDFALKPLPSSYNRPKGFDYLPQVLQESGQQKRKARSPPQMRPAVKIPASEKAVRVANQSDKPARKVARAAVSMEPAAKTPEPKTPPPKKQQQQHQLPEKDSKQQNLMTPIRPAKWVLQDTKDRRASEDRKLGPRGMSGPGIFSQNPHQQQRQPQAVPLKTIANEDDDELMGPYDFRKLLRKTNIAPTESLKLRKGLINPKTSVFPVTSNSWSANESVLRSDLRARLQPVAKI
ncbi:unnamed protein product [Notodromas monacha]|uniref:Uncharacterized protein n=1 Tax=Notodromas monacha TaxID=399045 RepID=A0A7R9BWG0_9CRUS|nr:unnamed protein product [Notodromas monacha]CAG0923055.1 unnamed protein product [Notodromas monacha]